MKLFLTLFFFVKYRGDYGLFSLLLFCGFRGCWESDEFLRCLWKIEGGTMAFCVFCCLVVLGVVVVVVVVVLCDVWWVLCVVWCTLCGCCCC